MDWLRDMIQLESIQILTICVGFLRSKRIPYSYTESCTVYVIVTAAEKQYLELSKRMIMSNSNSIDIHFTQFISYVVFLKAVLSRVINLVKFIFKPIQKVKKAG